MRQFFANSPRRVFLFLSTAVAISQAVTFGTYVLFLKEGIGLSPLEINLVNLAFYVSRVFLEVPTGAIADVLGRRVVFIVACALYGFGLLMYWDAVSLWGCIAAELVLAIGSSCASGSFEAWIIDELKERGEEDQISEVLAREASYRQLGMLIAAPIGSVSAVYFGLASPWLIAAVCNGLLGIGAFLLIRETRVSQHAHRPFSAFCDTARTSLVYAVSPGKVRLFLIMGFLWMFALMAPNMQWAPLFEKKVGGIIGTGFLFSGLVLCMALGARLAPWLLRRFGDRTSLVIAVVMVGGGIILTPLVPLLAAFAPFALLELFRGMYAPLKAASLNRAIDSNDRATVLSCEAMTSHLGGMFGLFVTGVLAQYVSVSASWAFAGMACLLGAFLMGRFSVAPSPELAVDPL